MNFRSIHYRRSRRASALLLVLWALLLLTAAVLTWAQWIQDGIVLHGEGNRALEARAMAHSAIAVALHPLVSRKTQLPDEDLGSRQGFKIRMIGEGGRLNINWLLRGEEPAKLTMLKQWLERRGLNFEQREILVDSLLDYVDGDNVTRLNGFEGDDQSQPANRELRNIREIASVHGAGPLVSQPGWEDDLTLYSQGPVDLDSASVEILSLLPGLGESRIRLFVQQRQGRDGLDGTPDDFVFKNLGDIQQFLGLSAGQLKSLNGLIGYKDPTVRIIGEGHSGDVTRQVEVVVRKGAGKPLILSWKE